MNELDQRLDEIARTPVLLVASDFDGTLANLVPLPEDAQADPGALVALRGLAKLPQTHVAVISGRALGDLAARTPDLDDMHRVGSHGSEFEAGFAVPIDPQIPILLQRIADQVRPIADATPGALLEMKPSSLAFHYRNVEAGAAEIALRHILQGPAQHPGVHLRHGKAVVELSMVKTDKGLALAKLRQRLGATAVLYLGDDVTDEDAFATLSGPDVAVKVGPGASRAGFRAADPRVASQVLARVVERRAEWVAGSCATPIDRHALLSDQRTLALMDDAGRTVWMCVPRLDSAALFSELLGGPSAGFFEVRPRDPRAISTQAYLGHTFILRTQWPGLCVTDYLDCGGSRPYQRAGRTDFIRVVEGSAPVRITFAPRYDFGRVATRLRARDEGIEVEGTSDSIVLRAPGVVWRILDEGEHQTAIAEFQAGQTPLVLELRYGTGNFSADPAPEPVRRERTAASWSRWAATLQLPGLEDESVMRSALVLKALTYGPTGAIAAAATTSLPEHAGGVRNWDYRYCWPRDAAMAAASLVRLGVRGPAMKFLDWVLGICEDQEPGALPNPVYTVTGGHLGQEGEVAQLSGYRGSRPVRVGNAAAHQVQLDVLGPIAELMALLAGCGEALSSEHSSLLESIVLTVSRKWREADHGIWEVRKTPQHHVHSKAMCWLAVDRAIRVARYLGKRRLEWEALRDTIAESVLREGWNAEIGAFSGVYAGDQADAAVLMLATSGLLPADDARIISTVDFVQSRLRDSDTVFRYRFDDGLPGQEGGFHICTAWLVQALSAVGRVEDAAALLHKLVSLAGPTGLLSEQFDPVHRCALGNYPQAYSHLGIIDSAVAVRSRLG